ncbi:hypothetical protein F511_36333 [Dorcoceras hygrometricum]|uniref:Uncharacterized protein n=1 Tax=Dorcoceras hygrometricum TaxID=472368 RepID=A0A2Z7DC43_9LAMI|nr:hypothetical protein F511_36333 [Dorcoceras hygrometricum]
MAGGGRRREAAAAAAWEERKKGATVFKELGLGITDSACKNQLVVVSVQYGPFNPYIPIRSTIIDNIGYPRMSASGESSTTMHRLLHASGPHPIPPPNDPKPDPATSSCRTPRLHQPSAGTHLFYAYVRKATNTEFNVVVLGRDLTFVCDSLAKQLRTSLKICE